MNGDSDYRVTLEEARSWARQHLHKYLENESQIQHDLQVTNRLRDALRRLNRPSRAELADMDHDERSMAYTNMSATPKYDRIKDRQAIVGKIYKGVNPAIAGVWIKSYPDRLTDAYDKIENLLLDFGIELHFLKKYHPYEYQRCFLNEIRHHKNALDWLDRCRSWLEEEEKYPWQMPKEVKVAMFQEFRSDNADLFEKVNMYESPTYYKTVHKASSDTFSKLWYYIEKDFYACCGKVEDTKNSGFYSHLFENWFLWE